MSSNLLIDPDDDDRQIEGVSSVRVQSLSNSRNRSRPMTQMNKAGSSHKFRSRAFIPHATHSHMMYRSAVIPDEDKIKSVANLSDQAKESLKQIDDDEV